ncbi:30S ribosomal protein S4 [bacterium]|nr:30S ribosomal protein S4 [bacterium]
MAEETTTEEKAETTSEAASSETKGAGLRFMKSKGVCRKCRRLGVKLFLKGEKCTSAKCPLIKRSYAPGQHGQKQTKISDYGRHLREKQKLVLIYSLKDRQLRRLIWKASRKKENTEEEIIQALERRLDSTIYRLGWALSRRQARKLVNGGFFSVNGRRIDRPGYLVNKKDKISLSERAKNSKLFKNIILPYAKEAEVPAWLKRKETEAEVLRFPQAEEAQLNVDLSLVIEFYKR